jgi:peptide deformylase
MINVLKFPHPILLKPSLPVTDFSQAAQIVTELRQASKESRWGQPVGFAANQIGHLRRVFITADLSGGVFADNVFINPEILWLPKGGEKRYKEGCYSLEDDNFSYDVVRPYAVTLKWQDLDQNWHEERFNGFKAQVILHEFDHINGILCNQKR